jgi:hypothetical protein
MDGFMNMKFMSCSLLVGKAEDGRFTVITSKNSVISMRKSKLKRNKNECKSDIFGHYKGVTSRDRIQ